MTTEPSADHTRIPLVGFTPGTLDFLAERAGLEPTEAVADGIPRRSALHFVHELRATDDDAFPGGKWATIQHLESLIGAA